MNIFLQQIMFCMKIGDCDDLGVGRTFRRWAPGAFNVSSANNFYNCGYVRNRSILYPLSEHYWHAPWDMPVEF